MAVRRRRSVKPRPHTVILKGDPAMEAAKDNSRLILKWGIVVALALLTLWACLHNGLPQTQVSFFTITVFALAIFALDLLPDALVATVLPAAYIIAGVGKPGIIYAPWGSTVGWVMLGGMLFAAIMLQTGLAKRLSLWCMHLAGGSINKLLFGIVAAGYILGPAIPTMMGKAALVLVICVGICESLNIEKKTPLGAAILFAGFLSFSASRIAYLTGGGDIVMYVKTMTQKLGITITWNDYFIHHFGLAVIYAALSLFVVILVLRPKSPGGIKDFVETERAKLGSMKIAEVKTAALLILLVALMATDKYHGIDAAWIILILCFVAALPGFNLLDLKRFNSVSLSPLLFVLGCMTIGSGAQACGVDKVMAQAVVPYMQGSSDFALTGIGYWLGVAVNFLLTPLAALSSMTVPLTEIIHGLGVNPVPVMYAFNYGLDQYIFPYEFAGLLYVYSAGYISMRQLMVVCGVRMLVGFGFLMALCYPYWEFLGLYKLP